MSHRNIVTEVLCLMHWDARLEKAFRRALKDYEAAGSPGVPMGSTDYRKTYAKQASARIPS